MSRSSNGDVRGEVLAARYARGEMANRKRFHKYMQQKIREERALLLALGPLIVPADYIVDLRRKS